MTTLLASMEAETACRLFGYKVIFLPSQNGEPVGYIDSATDFLTEDGEARGRPVGVTLDPRGALIVADDLSNTVWRIAVTDEAAASN